jgi:lipoprotein NlpI
MERGIDPREQLRMIEPLLEKYEGLSEKHFDAEMVKAELEKLSKEELIELQVKMFAQYHEMAKSLVEMAEALKVALQSRDVKPD